MVKNEIVFQNEESFEQRLFKLEVGTVIETSIRNYKKNPSMYKGFSILQTEPIFEMVKRNIRNTILDIKLKRFKLLKHNVRWSRDIVLVYIGEN